MLLTIVMLWVLNQLTAPTWCFVLTWITLAIEVINFLVQIYNAGAQK